MTSFLSRVVAAVRVFFGLNDPIENRLQASHGRVLAPAIDLRGRAVAVSSAPSAVKVGACGESR
jgi:hypothetical protein